MPKTTPPVPRQPAGRAAARPRGAAATTPPRKAPAPPDGNTPAPAPDLSPGPALLEGPTREELIRVRAYERYARNGCADGHDVDDWLAAEAEVGALMTERSGSAAAPAG